MELYFGEDKVPKKFLIHKIYSILKESRAPLSLVEIEKVLQSQGFSKVYLAQNSEIIAEIENKSRIVYDKCNKTLFYDNPYNIITSPLSLFNFVNRHGHILGMKITECFVKMHGNSLQWIHSVLNKHAVRCVRTRSQGTLQQNKSESSVVSFREKIYINEARNTLCHFVLNYIITNQTASSRKIIITPALYRQCYLMECDLYGSKKCKNCFNNVYDYFLYPTGDPEYEKLRRNNGSVLLRRDWYKHELPSLDVILKYSSAFRRKQQVFSEKKKSAKSKASKTDNTGLNKVRKVYNTHIFSMKNAKNLTE